jgi:hypothetical protein
LGRWAGRPDRTPRRKRQQHHAGAPSHTLHSRHLILNRRLRCPPAP